VFQDTWEWDGAGWALIKLSSSPPATTSFQPAVYDAARGATVLCYANDYETWAYAPHDLTASTHLVSVATGGRVRLSIDAGKLHAGKHYWVLGCAEGSGPRGIPSLKVRLLLYPDPYFWFTARVPNPMILNSLGTLDASGRAAATIFVPPLPSSLIGWRFYHAYVAFQANVDYASTAVPLTLVK
jgi:hypothetical protein